MIARVNTFKKLAIGSALAVTALFSATAASAATFGVRVVSPDGQPVAGASVCIGLAGNYSQFGAEFTGADGIVTVDVPNVPLVVTVSKTRFAGLRIEEPARGFNLVKQITLVDGVPGPRCRAGSTMAEGPGIPEITIENIDINQGAALVLKPTVTGEPSHYRIGVEGSLDNAKWKPYTESIRVAGALANESSLEFQLRQYAGNSKGWLESRSSVVTIAIPN